jgi:sugar phosphate isomerase/epimerase
MLTSSWLSRSAHANPLGRPIGIQLYAVNSALQEDPAGTLKNLRDIGFREVETAGFGKLSAQEFRKLLDDAGLACPSAHLPFDVANLGPTFEAAHALGTHYVASGWLRSSLRPPITNFAYAMSLDEAKQTAELANRIGEKAKQAGLQYAYHNHNFEFVDQGGAIGYDILLRETDPNLVKFEIDCGWMVVGGRNPIDYFRKYPNRFPMIHVKDFLPAQDPGTDAGKAPAHPGAELGHGIIDYKPIFAAAEKAGLQHFFVEQEGPFVRMSQLQAAQQAYDYLRAIK